MHLVSWLYQWTTGRRHTRRTPVRKPAPGFRPQLRVLEARDLPSFTAPVAYPASQPLAVVAADVNGDGSPDLITLASNGASVSWQLNNKQGGFGPAHGTFGPTATALAVGDVNGDGNPDIVLANASSSGDGGFPIAGSISVLLGDGKGGFTRNPANGGQPQYIFPAPVASLALAHLYGGSETGIVGVPAHGGGVFVARPGDTHGDFTRVLRYNIPTNPSSTPCRLTVGDVNGDGKPDVVVTEPYQNSIGVLLNNGSGALGTPQYFAVGATPTAVAVGDVSGDGKLDVVTANANGMVSVLLGQGNGTFGAAQTYAVGGPVNSVVLADFNHDGRLDIATAGGTETDVLLNNGGGTFGAYQKVGPAASSVVAADFNGDGYPDLAEVLASGNSVDVLFDQANW